mmetsp:Transcript_34863/g.73125  ORF Transcript_34863/g.73125 Transcript_34863/m.73125 type:complete len:138 (-) Transcript_34863:2471-2884(-)
MIKSPIKELKDEADRPIRKTSRRLKIVLDRLNYEKEKKEKLKIDLDSACDDDRPGDIKAQVKGRRTSPSQRCESGSYIKNQNKKAIRYYKEKNRRDNKTYGRVTPRGMSIRKKTRTHKNIVAVEDTKEEKKHPQITF